MKGGYAAGSAAGLAAVHALLWVAWLAALLFYVPGRAKVFEETRYKLPWLTQVLVDVSRWCVDYWFILPPAVLFLLAADAAILFLLLRRTRGTWLGWVWSGLMVVAPLGAWLVTLLALWLPLLKIQEELRGPG